MKSILRVTNKLRDYNLATTQHANSRKHRKSRTYVSLQNKMTAKAKFFSSYSLQVYSIWACVAFLVTYKAVKWHGKLKDQWNFFFNFTSRKPRKLSFINKLHLNIFRGIETWFNWKFWFNGSLTSRNLICLLYFWETLLFLLRKSYCIFVELVCKSRDFRENTLVFPVSSRNWF